MENKNIIIILLAIIVILLAAVLGMMMLQPNTKSAPVEINQTNSTVEEITADPVAPDTIKVELPGFDTMYTETAGEYSVEAEKWMSGSVGGFEVHLYKNGVPVNKDSYMTRAYYNMDGEWKWSEWGNGEDGYKGYHKYPVSRGVEIQEVEVKF